MDDCSAGRVSEVPVNPLSKLQVQLQTATNGFNISKSENKLIPKKSEKKERKKESWSLYTACMRSSSKNLNDIIDTWFPQI
jgi:hypothetical protein